MTTLIIMHEQEYEWWKESEELLAGGAPQSRPHHMCGIPWQGTADDPSIPTEPAEACGRHGGDGAAAARIAQGQGRAPDAA